MNNQDSSHLIDQAHNLYCRLTAQNISMRFDRQRMWFELLRHGFGLQDIESVIFYLQKEILRGRRNVGALKISNLTQPDRFEEDLAICRVRLRPPQKPAPTAFSQPEPDPTRIEEKRQRALRLIRDLKNSIK